MIPEGTYAAVVAPVTTKGGAKNWCQFGESGQKKTPLVMVQFEILRGPHAGQRITWYGYFSEENPDVTDRTIKSLRACGFSGEQFGDMVTQAVDQEVSIVVEHEEYQGKRRARVLWVNAVGGGGLKVENQMSASQMRLFSSKLASRLKAFAPASGPKAVREQASGQHADGGAEYDQSAPPDDGDPGPSDDGARDTRVSAGDDDIPW